MLFDTDRISAFFSWVSNATWEKYFVVYVYNQPKNQQPVLIWVNFVELFHCIHNQKQSPSFSNMTVFY